MHLGEDKHVTPGHGAKVIHSPRGVCSSAMELLSAIESFESRFNETNAQLYLRARWKRCFYASAIYVVAILVGRHYMKSRPGFDLRRTLFAWNLLLALFSAVGTYHVTVPFVTDVLTSGWSSAVCTLKFLEACRQYDYTNSDVIIC